MAGLLLLLGYVLHIESHALKKSWDNIERSLAAQASSELEGDAEAAHLRQEHPGLAADDDAGEEAEAAPLPGPLTEEDRARCVGTIGGWCGPYYAQPTLPEASPPKGTKTCVLDCNGVGVCDGFLGLCRCPAGWQNSLHCAEPALRHCANKHYRSHGFKQDPIPGNVSLGVGIGSAWSFPRTHCSGYCLDTIAACMCPSNTPYGYLPPDPKAPIGSPPKRWGRVMGFYCQPNETEDGRPSGWGWVDPDQLFSPKHGWCMVPDPTLKCDCILDGLGGPGCNVTYEQTCPNQCNGHGDCKLGFCKWWVCGLRSLHRSLLLLRLLPSPGRAAALVHWYWAVRQALSGLCRRPFPRMADSFRCLWPRLAAPRVQPRRLPPAFASAMAPLPGPASPARRTGLAAVRPWVAEVVHTPAAAEALKDRTRPLIYVYDLDPLYNQRMLEYRLDSGQERCVSRLYSVKNESLTSGWVYALEMGLHEMLLQSKHRTLNPEEADYFYVPVYTSCFIHPVRDSADSLADFFYGAHHNRVMGASNMLLEAYHWLRAHHPYWVPAAIRPSIILSHWGRKGKNHTSDTAYGPDDYSANTKHPHWDPKGFLPRLGGEDGGARLSGVEGAARACSGALPTASAAAPLVSPLHSPLLGARARNRTFLAFHRGRVQTDLPKYSRGVRQRVAKAALEGKWQEKHNIVVGGYEKIQGEYTELMSSSVFCLVMMGDGWSARMDDAMLHGCIPVIIMDGIDVSFQTLLDWESFSLRIPSADAEKLPEASGCRGGCRGVARILLAVPKARVEAMQRRIAQVWSRVAWTSYRPYAKRVRVLQRENAERRRAAAGRGEPEGASLPMPVPDLDPERDDAFGTLMQWLYWRLLQLPPEPGTGEGAATRRRAQRAWWY
eukprot:scaffold7.g3579.t1